MFQNSGKTNHNETWAHAHDHVFRLSNPAFQPTLAPPHIEEFLQEVHDRIALVCDQVDRTSHSSLDHNDNFPESLREAVIKLKNNKDIIIKPADKNLGPTIMDKTWYNQEMLSQLRDTSVYTPIQRSDAANFVEKVASRISSRILTWKLVNHLPERLCEFISTPPIHCKPCRAYLLPKIHKEKVGGRLICPNTNWCTLNLSKWLAAEFNEVARTIPTILKDSRELIKDLQNVRVSKSSRLITFDVVSLYPNIVHSEARRNISSLLGSSAKTECLLEFLDVVMENNVLEFEGNCFHQITGTAMGTPVAPPYANLFLAKFEADLLNALTHQPRYYKRFIDDGFIIWDSPDEILIEFLDKWNSTYSTIKITYKVSRTNVQFLDLNIFIDKGNVDIHGFCPIQFTNFDKPLNNYLYIPYNSFCPKHILKGFIKGRCISLAINNSQEKGFQIALEKLLERLHRRGYPHNFVNKIVATVQYQDRIKYLNNPINSNRNDSSRKFQVFVKFTPSTARKMNIKNIIVEVYKKHPLTHATIGECPMVGYLKGRNLRRLLN